jgi:predicted lipoprotein with Yx(FWY)xxD motif
MQPKLVRQWLRRALVVAIAASAGAAVAALTDLALAKSTTTLGVADNSTTGKAIVVDSRGVTLYELRPETTHHLLCTKAKGCFRVWLPVRVGSARTKLTAAHGIKGRLGTLHRNGLFQLTLGGHPLYRFAGDNSKKGAANGQDLHSFGGTWHVVVVRSIKSTSPTQTMTTQTDNTTPTETNTTSTTCFYPPC